MCTHHTHTHLPFSTALPCMLRGPASVRCGGMCGLISGWGGNVGVALIMRMLISFNVDDDEDDERALTRRVGAMLVDSLSHIHTHTHAQIYTNSLSHRRPSSCCAYFKHTHRQATTLLTPPPPLYLCLSLLPPTSPLPALVCIVENGFIENVVCFSIWFCSAAFYSSAPPLLFCLLLACSF